MRALLVSFTIGIIGCSGEAGERSRVHDAGRADVTARARQPTALEEAVGRDISAVAGEPAVVHCDQPPQDGGIDCTVEIGGRVVGVTITMWGSTSGPQGWSLSDGSLRNLRMPHP